MNFKSLLFLFFVILLVPVADSGRGGGSRGSSSSSTSSRGSSSSSHGSASSGSRGSAASSSSRGSASSGSRGSAASSSSRGSASSGSSSSSSNVGGSRLTPNTGIFTSNNRGAASSSGSRTSWSSWSSPNAQSPWTSNRAGSATNNQNNNQNPSSWINVNNNQAGSTSNNQNSNRNQNTGNVVNRSNQGVNALGREQNRNGLNNQGSVNLGSSWSGVNWNRWPGTKKNWADWSRDGVTNVRTRAHKKEAMRLLMTYFMGIRGGRRVAQHNSKQYFNKYRRPYWMGNRYYYLDREHNFESKIACFYDLTSEDPQVFYEDGTQVQQIVFQCRKYFEECCDLDCCKTDRGARESDIGGPIRFSHATSLQSNVLNHLIAFLSLLLTSVFC